MPESTKAPVTNAVVLSTIEWLDIVHRVQHENKKFRDENHSLFRGEKPATQKVTRGRPKPPPLREEKKQGDCSDLQRLMAQREKEARERRRLEKQKAKPPKAPPAPGSVSAAKPAGLPRGAEGEAVTAAQSSTAAVQVPDTAPPLESEPVVASSAIAIAEDDPLLEPPTKKLRPE
eukprot:EG_transcript_28143